MPSLSPSGEEGALQGGRGRLEVRAVEVVLQDLAVEVDEGALAAEFLQPGVGESPVQAGAAFVNGTEQTGEVEPDRARVVIVAVLEGMLEGSGGEQAAVLADSLAERELRRPDTIKPPGAVRRLGVGKLEEAGRGLWDIA